MSNRANPSAGEDTLEYDGDANDPEALVFYGVQSTIFTLPGEYCGHVSWAKGKSLSSWGSVPRTKRGKQLRHPEICFALGVGDAHNGEPHARTEVFYLVTNTSKLSSVDEFILAHRPRLAAGTQPFATQESHAHKCDDMISISRGGMLPDCCRALLPAKDLSSSGMEPLSSSLEGVSFLDDSWLTMWPLENEEVAVFHDNGGDFGSVPTLTRVDPKLTNPYARAAPHPISSDAAVPLTAPVVHVEVDTSVCVAVQVHCGDARGAQWGFPGCHPVLNLRVVPTGTAVGLYVKNHMGGATVTILFVRNLRNGRDLLPEGRISIKKKRFVPLLLEYLPCNQDALTTDPSGMDNAAPGWLQHIEVGLEHQSGHSICKTLLFWQITPRKQLKKG